MQRVGHFKRMLVTLGSVEVGVATYLGSRVASGTAGQATVVENLGHGTLYALCVALIGVLTVAYLHTFKIFISYALYVVKLEIIGLQPGLRSLSEVFDYSQDSHLPLWLRGIMSLGGTINAVALFPVVMFLSTVVLFGDVLGIETDVFVAIAITFAGWMWTYLAPLMIQYQRFVRLAMTSS